jgi:hypothetical protein
MNGDELGLDTCGEGGSEVSEMLSWREVHGDILQLTRNSHRRLETPGGWKLQEKERNELVCV